MDETDRQSSKHKQREHRILNAATDLLLRYGYDKTTVGDIAKTAGVSKGAIYLHFDSKETLFDGLIMREFREYGLEVMRQLEADAELWSFAGMYRNALAVMVKRPLLTAMLRGDKQILGNLMMNSAILNTMRKRKQGDATLKKMQEAGVLRDDLDMDNAQYLMSCMSYGMISIQDVIPPAEAPPMEEIILMYGDMLERWLEPEGGGNREAGKRIIMGFIDAFNKQMNVSNQDDEKGD